MKYRIAFIFPSIQNDGGSVRVMLNLAKAFQQLGHSIDLFSVKPCSEIVDPELPKIKVFNLRFRRDLFQLSRISRILRNIEKREGKFDLILSNLEKRGLLKPSRPEKLFYLCHLDYQSAIEHSPQKDDKHRRRAISRIQKKFSHRQVICVSKGAEKGLIALGVQPKTIQTLYNGFDFEEIESLSNAYQPPIQEPYLIHVGRFTPVKNHSCLFRAYQRLKNPPRLVLLAHPSEALKALIRSFNLDDQILLPGVQTNPFPWIKQAKALILSSNVEALPGVLIESLICKTPAVSTDCRSGPNEILTGDWARWLVPVGDDRALAEKIQDVLDSPYEPSWDRLEPFNIHQVIQQYLKLIEA